MRIPFQTSLTGLTIVIVFLVLTPTRHAVVAASIASTAFMVFLVPHSRLAESRCVFWGHVLAIPPGLAAGLLAPPSAFAAAVFYGFSVVTAGLLMLWFSRAHPPAAGTALGLALAPEPRLVASVLVGAGILALLHRALGHRLLDITEEPVVAPVVGGLRGGHRPE